MKKGKIAISIVCINVLVVTVIFLREIVFG